MSECQPVRTWKSRTDMTLEDILEITKCPLCLKIGTMHCLEGAGIRCDACGMTTGMKEGFLERLEVSANSAAAAEIMKHRFGYNLAQLM